MMMTNMFNDLFNDRMYGWNMNSGFGAMRSDIFEYPDHYEIHMDLAGFRREDVHAELKDGMLTVKATRANAGTDDARALHTERFVGEFSRSFRVGERVRKEDIKAAYEDGVLRIVIPKETENSIPEDHQILIQ